MNLLTVFRIVVIQLTIVSFGNVVSGADTNKSNQFEINTVLMESTVKIEGRGSTGTGFVMGRSLTDSPNQSRFTLITAAHILDDIQGESPPYISGAKLRKEGGQELRCR